MTSEGMQFGIPQDDVIKVVRVSSETSTAIARTQGGFVLQFERELIPVVPLSSILGFKK